MFHIPIVRDENEPQTYPGNDCTVIRGNKDGLRWGLVQCDANEALEILCEYDMVFPYNGKVLTLKME